MRRATYVIGIMEEKVMNAKHYTGKFFRKITGEREE